MDSETKAVMIGLTKGYGPEQHLAIPADEAREFLDEVIDALTWRDEDSEHEMCGKARALLALLPKEAAENEAEV